MRRMSNMLVAFPLCMAMRIHSARQLPVLGYWFIFYRKKGCRDLTNLRFLVKGLGTFGFLIFPSVQLPSQLCLWCLGDGMRATVVNTCRILHKFSTLIPMDKDRIVCARDMPLVWTAGTISVTRGDFSHAASH